MRRRFHQRRASAPLRALPATRNSVWASDSASQAQTIASSSTIKSSIGAPCTPLTVMLLDVSLRTGDR